MQTDRKIPEDHRKTQLALNNDAQYVAMQKALDYLARKDCYLSSLQQEVEKYNKPGYSDETQGK